jgi:hypothetical protein
MATRTSSATPIRGGPPGRLAGALRALLGRSAFESRGGMFAAALALRLAGTGLLGWIGYVHWYLWHLGYKDIPTDGPFFLVDAIAAALLGVLLLAWPRALAGLASAGFVASTIVALVISLSVGLFGFRESISASYVVESLVLESVAVLILAAWTVIVSLRVPRSDTAGSEPSP